MELRAEIVRSARAASASGVAWGVLAGLVCLVATYLAANGLTGAHAGAAVATLAIGFAARARSGLGAGAAFATAFAALAPIFFLSAWQNANETVLGPGDWCGTGRLMRSAQLALVGALVAFALPLGLLSMRRPVPRRRSRLPLGVVLPALAVIAGVLAALGAERLRSRPDIQAFRRDLTVYATIPPRAVDGPCLLSRSGCDDVLFSDDAITVVRHCYSKTACRLGFDLHDGLGKRPPTLLYDAAGPAQVFRDVESRAWALAGADSAFVDHRMRIGVAAVEGRRSWNHTVEPTAIRGAIAPDADAVVFGAAGALLALLGAFSLRRHARRVASIQSGVDAEIGDDGWVSVAGGPAESRRPSPGTDQLAPGPVVVAADAPVDSYRGAAAPPTSVIAIGTKRDVIEAMEASAHERAFIVFVAALHLVTPLFATALAGRVL